MLTPSAFAVLLLAQSAAPQAPTLSTAQIESLDQVISAHLSKHGVPGLTAAIALGGEVIWAKAYGLADVENSVPARVETAYRSASIGKTITATAALRLVEDGKLDLDRPIQEHCPAFPPKPWVITPRHLLAHQAGIRHYGGPRDQEEQTSTTHYATVEASLAPFKDDPLRFEPGTDYLYSTYGFNVLGCVMEGAARAPFMEVIRRVVFEPAGMSHSRDDDPAAIVSHRAAGYVRVNGTLANATHVDMSNRLPAGGYLTTALELAAFAARFIDCKLVSCATRDRMLTAQKFRDGGSVNYGLGWAVGEDDAGKPDGTASHGGSSPGASGMLYIVPQQRFAVVVLSNLESMPERSDLVRAMAGVVRAPLTEVPSSGP